MSMLSRFLTPYCRAQLSYPLGKLRGYAEVWLADCLEKTLSIFLTGKNTDITRLFDNGNAPLGFAVPDTKGGIPNRPVQASIALKAAGIDARILNNHPASW